MLIVLLAAGPVSAYEPPPAPPESVPAVVYHNFTPTWSHLPDTAIPSNSTIWACFGTPVVLADPEQRTLIHFRDVHGRLGYVHDARLIRYQRPEYPTRVYWRLQLEGDAATVFGDFPLHFPLLWPAAEMTFSVWQRDLLLSYGEWAPMGGLPVADARYTFAPTTTLRLRGIWPGGDTLTPQLGQMSAQWHLMMSEPVFVTYPASASVHVTHPIGQHTATWPLARHEPLFAYYAPRLDRAFQSTYTGHL